MLLSHTFKLKFLNRLIFHLNFFIIQFRAIQERAQEKACQLHTQVRRGKYAPEAEVVFRNWNSTSEYEKGDQSANQTICHFIF